MDINRSKSALMFCRSNKFKQKSSNLFIFPQVNVYKYLGVLIMKNGSLGKDYKLTENKMMMAACKLASVRSDKISPGRLITLFLVVAYVKFAKLVTCLLHTSLHMLRTDQVRDYHLEY